MVENTATVFHTNSGLITLKGDNLDNLDVQEERESKKSDFNFAPVLLSLHLIRRL